MFGDSDGAGKFFAAVRARDAVFEHETGLAPIETARVGDNSYAYATPHAVRGTVRTVLVTWREGRFVATALANGFAQRMSVQEVLALARRQDRRLAGTR